MERERSSVYADGMSADINSSGSVEIGQPKTGTNSRNNNNSNNSNNDNKNSNNNGNRSSKNSDSRDIKESKISGKDNLTVDRLHANNEGVSSMSIGGRTGSLKNEGGAFNTTNLVLSHKPISTSSPEAMAAAQQVTPKKLAQLLLSRGPLAIRFITQALVEEIPSFKDLSASKQRRLIMSALEAGDQENSVVFAKIGWGQWSAKHVEPHMFDKEREVTNLANSKVKDIVSQEGRRRSSSNKKSMKSGTYLKEIKKPIVNATAGMYIDENALASDEDEEEDDEPLHYDRIKRRQSSVVNAESPPDNGDSNDVQLKNVFNKGAISGTATTNNRRRSSSKIRSVSVSKPGVYRSPVLGNEYADSIYRRLPSPQSDHRSKSLIDVAKNDEVLPDELLSASNSTTAKAAVRRTSGVTRRDARLSFSKESSIRSTLLLHSNYNIVSPPTHPLPPIQAVTPMMTGDVDNENPSSLKLEHPSPVREMDHSDTDEEDWASIGAPALRNNSLPPNLSSPIPLREQSTQTSPRLDPLKQGYISRISNSPPSPSSPSHNSITHNQQSYDRQEKHYQYRPPVDTEDAAFLLMSLKS